MDPCLPFNVDLDLRGICLRDEAGNKEYYQERLDSLLSSVSVSDGVITWDKAPSWLRGREGRSAGADPMEFPLKVYSLIYMGQVAVCPDSPSEVNVTLRRCIDWQTYVFKDKKRTLAANVGYSFE